MRGGERVLEQFCLLFPDAPIFTLFHRKKKLRGKITEHTVYQSWLGRLPFVEKYYRGLLPVFPAALRSLKVPPHFDLILCCDASVIKGLNFQKPTRQCCYCCSPPRYLFDLQDQYLSAMTDPLGLKRNVVGMLSPSLKRYDVKAAGRVDSFITLSAFVQERIQRIYGRESVVVEPPVDVESFSAKPEKGDFYLIVSALVPYKRVDLAIEACNHLKRRLVVIGEGPDQARLRGLAGPTIEFRGPQGFKALQSAYRDCRAFLFPGIEDFGITALEAQAAGKQVIAIRRGGVVETVIEGRTGVFFDEQTVASLAAAIGQFECAESSFSEADARGNADRYRPSEFRRKLKESLAASYPDLFSRYEWPI